MENKHTYIIDRFEGDFAICERDDLKFENIKKEKLPKDIAEGDVIFFDGKKYIKDIEKTSERKRYIEDLTKDLWI